MASKRKTLLEFLATRILLTIPMILILVTVVFFVMRVLPGDPALAILGPKATDEDLAAMRERLGIDRPLHVQYFDYLLNILRLDLGKTMTSGRLVLNEIMQYLPTTVELALCGIFVAAVTGIYFGKLCVKKRGSVVDKFVQIGLIVRWCMPVFWLGIILQIILSVYLGILPISGRIDTYITLQRISGLNILDSLLTLNFRALISSIQHLIMPTICIGTTLGASLGRMARVNMVKILDEDFVATLRLKGCSEDKILNRHVLPNALIPILTYAGLQFAFLMGGLILTETVFSLPGMGRLLLFAVNNRDYQLIQGCVVIFALIVGLVNLVVDVLYAVVDPRVRY